MHFPLEMCQSNALQISKTVNLYQGQFATTSNLPDSEAQKERNDYFRRFHPACLTCVVFWLTFVVVISWPMKMVTTGKPEDGMCKA